MKKDKQIYWWLAALLFAAGCSAAPQPTTTQTAMPVQTAEAPVLPSAAPSSTVSPVESQPVEPPAAATPTVPAVCAATSDDMLGPYYTPGAPVRDKVGQGYLLSGVVRSAADCQPIPGAMIEFWMAGPDGEYRDDYRATLMSGMDGAYRFESHAPPPYSNRPPHIHIKVTAQGFAELVTQHYPAQGATSAVFDLVLTP